MCYFYAIIKNGCGDGFRGDTWSSRDREELFVYCGSRINKQGSLGRFVKYSSCLFCSI